MFYSTNLRQILIIIKILFDVLQYPDQFAQRKNGCCYSKISKFSHCIRNVRSQLFNRFTISLTFLQTTTSDAFQFD